MARGYEPGDFLSPREVIPDGERPVKHAPPDVESRAQEQEERAPGTESSTTPGPTRSTEPRKVYEIRGRTYRLRTSETRTMIEVGKFRAIDLEDLAEFSYDSDNGRMRREVENLFRQGLTQMKTIPHEEKGSRQLLALTKAGHRFLTATGIADKDQALYFGFAKPRDAHHDLDLYRVYQKAADKIERSGGQNLRVVLDYELKKMVYSELAKLDPDRASAACKRSVAERHGLQVVGEKIPLPDVRIEYDTPDGDRARADIELATGHYRVGNLAEKVLAGFSMYAHTSDISNLRRVLDQCELTAQILSL
jgi:hypothetical protein